MAIGNWLLAIGKDRENRCFTIFSLIAISEQLRAIFIPMEIGGRRSSSVENSDISCGNRCKMFCNFCG